jgi:hypothetical protein
MESMGIITSLMFLGFTIIDLGDSFKDNLILKLIGRIICIVAWGLNIAVLTKAM